MGWPKFEPNANRPPRATAVDQPRTTLRPLSLPAPDGFNDAKITIRHDADECISSVQCESPQVRIGETRVIVELAEDTAEMKIYLFCPSCRLREVLPVR